MADIVRFLWLLVGVSRSPNMGPPGDEAKFMHDVVHPISGGGPHRQPVLGSVEVEGVLARHCLFLLGSPYA